jgi:hypothetical protein
MNSEHLTVLKNNRKQIIDITKSILQSASSPEDVFVEGFVDTYIENFDKIGAGIAEDHSSSEDIPFGIGTGEILLTLVILPIIVNLITELIKRKLDKSELVKKKKDEIIIILKRHRIKKPEKVATEILNEILKSI